MSAPGGTDLILRAVDALLANHAVDVELAKCSRCGDLENCDVSELRLARQDMLPAAPR